MPCSCGNTLCPCGIPCYCSEESCSCSDCAIALPRFCKVCYKQLTTDRTDQETCLCFLGESIALILQDHDKPQSRLGNIPIPIGCFLSGKLMVNVKIPIPAMGLPHSIPQQPLCLTPTVPPGGDQSKISLISGVGVENKLFHPLENSFPASELHHIVRKSNETIDYNLSKSGSDYEQNPEVFSKFRKPPGFLQSKEANQTANIVQNTKSETENNSNFAETTFYLPSIIIDNISFPVEMINPIWRLPNPYCCVEGSSNSTLNLINPFYMAAPISTTATNGNDHSESALCLNSEADDVKYFSYNQAKNIQPGSFVSLAMNEKTLDSTILLEQPSLEINNQNAEVAVSSNNTTGVKCAAHPSLESFNPMKSSLESGISENVSKTAKSQPFRTYSTFESGGKSANQANPDICNTENKISGNVIPESTGEEWQNVPLLEIPVTTDSNPPTRNATSRLQKFFNLNSQKENLQRDHLKYVSGNDKINEENIPLYIDSNTTQKMERFLKLSLH